MRNCANYRNISEFGNHYLDFMPPKNGTGSTKTICPFGSGLAGSCHAGEQSKNDYQTTIWEVMRVVQCQEVDRCASQLHLQNISTWVSVR